MEVNRSGYYRYLQTKAYQAKELEERLLLEVKCIAEKSTIAMEVDGYLRI